MVRFDKPCVKVSGAVEYFRENMAVGDYLTQEGQAEMTWVGQGVARLGLSGQCELPHFENLCRGLHPVTGEKLMVRDKGEHRRVCFFGQISPPKDVSLLHLVGGDSRIGEWWRESVADALREIEAVTATRVRRGGENRDRVTGNMVAAIVTHDASRALDPQLHTHICIMNLTYDAAEERWKSVQPSGYCSNSRFRESQMIYTSDKEAARDAMMRRADRKLALEMAVPVPAPDNAPQPAVRTGARFHPRVAAPGSRAAG